VTPLDVRNRQETPEAPQALLKRARLGDADARNRLIQDYTPFVLKVASQKAGRYLTLGSDDEVSVALLAFNEAIDAFDEDRGSFLTFSQTVIQRRLVDYFRRDRGRQHEVMLSDLELADEQRVEPGPLDRAAHEAWSATREEDERRHEIEEYQEFLAKLNIRFADLARMAPKHRDSRDRVISMARAAVRMMGDERALLERGELPVQTLAKEFGVSRRLIERHRTYILAVAVILLNDLPHLQEYLWERGNHE
jgi:RNA polymerase sigma factor